MPANASTPYYPSDWRGDPGLELCSYAARGLWHEMNVLMMLAEPYGYLMYDGRGLRESDVKEIARATRGDAKEVRRLLPELKRRDVYSIDDQGHIFSRKLVAMGPKRKVKQIAGAEGGKRTAQANAQARAAAKLLEQQRLSSGAQAHTLPNHTSSPTAREDASAHAGEAAQKSPAFEFCSWLLDEGLKRGVIPEHHAIDRFAWCHRNVAEAETLVASYGVDEPRVRALRFMDAKVARRIRRDLTPASLLAAWDWDEIKGTFTVGSTAPGKSFDDLMEGC